ncbi:MAG: ORC1-type DNA replication protein [Candidatus Bathyarchaeota archaeon]|nr:MAG: ORC1-type DNA replication protein [Candidatus Bathyarchaeota archaeon]
MSQPRSVFVDEAVLDLNYIPSRLLHRDAELRFLTNLFRFIVDTPYEMSQRALILGGVGSGKTALAQKFGLNLKEEARRRRVRVEYIHVNCRESRGSLFMILQRAVRRLRPNFPDRGFSANELLDTLMRILDEEDTQLVLCLDEVDALIDEEGSDALYNLTRVQEERLEGPRRLSLICISKDPEKFRELDKSTLSTLQRNAIRMPEYTRPQLSDIVTSRAEIAYRPGAISPEIIDFISELATSEGGDARYAIDILWRAGKYADTDYAREVLPEHVRKATAIVFPAIRPEEIRQLSRHEKLALLGIARHFMHSRETKATTGEAELSYQVVCEEYGEEPRGHTQFWKYLNRLSGVGVISTALQASERGRTQLISLPKVPAEALERELTKIIEQG